MLFLPFPSLTTKSKAWLLQGKQRMATREGKAGHHNSIIHISALTLQHSSFFKSPRLCSISLPSQTQLGSRILLHTFILQELWGSERIALYKSEMSRCIPISFWDSRVLKSTRGAGVQYIRFWIIWSDYNSHKKSRIKNGIVFFFLSFFFWLIYLLSLLLLFRYLLIKFPNPKLQMIWFTFLVERESKNKWKRRTKR